jgi:phage terminase small subunit
MLPPPAHLPEHARQFWEQHAPILEADGRLAPDTAAAFEVLAMTWQVIRTIDPARGGRDAITAMASQKQFLALVKQFGMTPASRRRPTEPAVAELDEFGL